ncbi:MAG: hypothetical protein ACYTF7_11210 [Planctomycetota bacterium]|jgi:hypothetical protein
METPDLVHYIPILTTLLSATFMTILLSRASKREWAPHLMWWAAGIFTYGVGTALESSVTLFGNSVALNKAWYIAGAVFGGYPLAQGSVYLHFPKARAHVMTILSLGFALILTGGILWAPIDVSALQSHRPSRELLTWGTSGSLGIVAINIYAVIFLVGTAMWSAIRFFTSHMNANRAWGNVLITVGALCPAVGGSMAAYDIVEGLYIGEFIGIIFIWWGYTMCVRAPKPTDLYARNENVASEAPQDGEAE